MMKNNVQKPMNRLYVLLLFSGLACLQTACGPDYYFQETKPIADGRWAYPDTLDFRFTVSDTLATYNLYLDFEYADTFSTQNIYVKLHTRFPDGNRLGKQKSFDLFDGQGQPLGECSGGTCRLHAVLQERAFFNQPGEYVITLEQYTRSNPLPGVRSVGLTLEATAVRR